MTDIDNTEYAILTTIKDADKPLWKKQIYDSLHRRGDAIPGSDVSLQTVGRRVDTLMEKDCLENVISSPDALDRDLIIAFTLTEEGKNAVKAKRRELVKDIVRTNLFPEDRHNDVPREPIVNTIREAFELDNEAENTLAEYDTAQLTAVLARHYAEHGVNNLLDEQERRLFRHLSESTAQEPEQEAAESSGPYEIQ